jgi:hypothetical protein
LLRYNFLYLFQLIIIFKILYTYIADVHYINITCLGLLFLMFQKVLYIVVYILKVFFWARFYKKYEAEKIETF